MYQSHVDAPENARNVLRSFGGLNLREACGPNELRDMMNLSSDAYPYLTVRAKRNAERLPEQSFRAATVHNGQLAAVFGDQLWLDGHMVVEHLSQYTETTSADCTLLSYGTNLLVMPHGVSYNTVAREVRGLGAFWHMSPPHFFSYGDPSAPDPVGAIYPVKSTCSLCDASGNVLTADAAGTAPDNPKDGQYWINTSEETHKLYRWSASNNMWVGVATTYIKLTIEQEGKFFSSADSSTTIKNAIKAVEDMVFKFREGDGIIVSGIVYGIISQGGTYSLIQKIGIDYVDQEINGKLYRIPQPYMVFLGMIDHVISYDMIEEDDYVEFRRDIPVMDYYTVSKNRVWGCVYSDYGEGIHEIRCCKLGDASNWNVFAGASTDSYTVSVGTPGAFTGAVTYENEPYFFKENTIMKVYGDYPSSYQLYNYSFPGVQAGSSGSLVVSGGYLYFKSAHDFYVFDGARPQSISYPLGFRKYRDAVCGTLGSKLYWSVLNEEGEHELLVYDRSTGSWYREKDARYLDFCQDESGHLYGVTDQQIVTFERRCAGEGEGTEWFGETGAFGLDLPDQKTVSRYTVRFFLEPGAHLSVLCSYDDGPFEHLDTCVGTGKMGSSTFSIRPVRCDHLRLRLEGKGKCMIYSIAYTLEQRSDRP